MAVKQRNIVVKAVTFVLFGLLILSFAVWGIGDIFRGPGQVATVAVVGEVEILQQDFARTLSREINRLSARFGARLDMEQARALGIVDQVLGQMIGRALFDQKAADMGLVVTDEQVLRRIQREPAFQNDLGEFDRARFVQTLQISGLGEQEYVATLRRDILRQQIANAVTDAISAPRQLAEALYRYREERRVAQVLTVPNDSITDLPEPDEAALEAFHKEFSASFMAPEFRTLTLVQLRAEDLATEIAVSETELREEFESRREDFVTPERRLVEQIVFPDEAMAREAESRLRGGADFAVVASDITGEAPVDLGAVEKDDLLPELVDAVFALDARAVSAPQESPLGWHILRVTNIEPRTEPSFEEVRADLARDTAMRLAVDSMIAIANQLDDQLGGGASLEEAAGGLDLKLRYIDAIDRAGKTADGDPVEDLPPGRFLEIAFATEAGEESLLTETSDGDYFILRVDGARPAQLRPLAEVREAVAGLWRSAQQANRAREKAEALAKRASQGADLGALAAGEGYGITTTEPLTRFATAAARVPSPALASKLFQIKPGEVTTASAPAGHVVAKLVEIRAADPAGNSADVSAVRDSLAAALQGDVLDQFVATLRGEYGVKVNERQLEALLATF